MSKEPTLSLERFDRTNTIGGTRSERPPAITMNKTGNFRLNKALVDMMKLKSGAGIAFHQDKVESADWYVERDDKNGFVLREGKNGALQFNTTPLFHKLTACVDGAEDGGTMLVSTEVVRNGTMLLYSLITSSLAVRKRKSRG